MTRKTKRRLIALVIVHVMAFGLVLPAAADEKLDTPELLTVGEPLLTADGDIQNPARHTQFRLLLFEEIEGATGYDVYAFLTRADALAGENALAVARNVGSTTPSQSGGGTQGTAAIELEEGQVGIDVRLLQYEELVEGATRDLPEGHTPAGLGDSYMPGTPGSGDTTNLKPGQYWFSVCAVDVDDPDVTSDLAQPHEDAYSIAIGPDEARDIILSRLDELGDTPEDTLRLIDLRAVPEFGDEGYVRFFDNRIVHTDFNTVEKAEAVFGHVEDKSEVTIFVMCRGGGRTASAARHLSDAGYTNVYNIQGINQWSFGLMYDDPTFRFRQIEEGEEGDLADPSTVDTPDGIHYDAADGAIRWYNIPRAEFIIYAFETAEETDPDNAVAVGTLPSIPLDVSGSTRDHRWVRKFDLAELELEDGVYYIRVQAVPDVEVPVEGMEDTIWGAPSTLSDAVEYDTDEETDSGGADAAAIPFTDVFPDDWYYDYVVGVYAEGLMAGVTETTFAPNGNMTIAQAITMAARAHAGGDDSFEEPEEGNWYDVYVDYAIENGIIDEEDFSDFSVNATRAQMAYIFANIIPEGQDPTSDLVPPDVDEDDEYAEEIYFLYSLGVLEGNDDEGTFAPDTNIIRAQAAAILLRIYLLD